MNKAMALKIVSDNRPDLVADIIVELYEVIARLSRVANMEGFCEQFYYGCAINGGNCGSDGDLKTCKRGYKESDK